MNFDWSQTTDIDENMVVYRSVPDGFVPRVTIAMPTFNRADTIKRALSSLAKQSFRDFVLIVSDNAGQDPQTLQAIKEFEEQLPGVILIAQPENKGALNNLHCLLSVAQTDYFMWLADDDEVTETYLEQLTGLLDEDRKAVAATGYWHSMSSPTDGYRRRKSEHAERSLLVRAVKYVAGPTNDIMFYGLHRTACLRRCKFNDYWLPNKGVLTNWCYVFLFDLILQGPIRHTEAAGWICHNYSEKQYNAAKAQGVSDRIKTLIRRINVYALYCGKACHKTSILLLPILLACIYGFTRDVVAAAVRISCRVLFQKR
ncbi:MAG: glycosyltransferase family 2 protein [Rickettsiales bacterium]|nr:glycosyltransferase family 2 protein [Rickettsiales bacterium]